MKYLDEFSNPDLAATLLDRIQGNVHPALGDHGGLRRADPLDHPARHRPVAARRDRDDPRPRLSGVCDAVGDHRPCAGHRRAARRDLLLLRRHAAGARQQSGPVPDQGRRRRRPRRVLAAGRVEDRQGEPGPPGGVLRDRLRDHGARQRDDGLSGEAPRHREFLAAGVARPGAAGHRGDHGIPKPAGCRPFSPPDMSAA